MYIMFTNITSDTTYKATYTKAESTFCLYYTSYKSGSAKTFTPCGEPEKNEVLKMLAAPTRNFENPSAFGLEFSAVYGKDKNRVWLSDLEIINDEQGAFSIHNSYFASIGTEFVICSNKVGNNQKCTIRHKPSGETIDLTFDVRMPKFKLGSRATVANTYDYPPSFVGEWHRVVTVLCELLDYEIGSQNISTNPNYKEFIYIYNDGRASLSDIPIEYYTENDNAQVQLKVDTYDYTSYGRCFIHANPTIENQRSDIHIFYTIFDQRLDLGTVRTYINGDYPYA